MTPISQSLIWHTMADKAMLKNETRYLCHYDKQDTYIILVRIDGKWYDDEDGEGQPYADPDQWAELYPDAP